MNSEKVISIMNQILSRQGKPLISSSDQIIRDSAFRSIDFAELFLRIEEELDKELNLDASHLRKIQTVEDIVSALNSIQ